MTTDEGQEIDRLVGRLESRYPQLSEAEVREAVSAAVLMLEGARLRQFAMVLIEKRATDMCRRRRAHSNELHPSRLTTSTV